MLPVRKVVFTRTIVTYWGRQPESLFAGLNAKRNGSQHASALQLSSRNDRDCISDSARVVMAGHRNATRELNVQYSVQEQREEGLLLLD